MVEYVRTYVPGVVPSLAGKHPCSLHVLCTVLKGALIIGACMRTYVVTVVGP